MISIPVWQLLLIPFIAGIGFGLGCLVVLSVFNVWRNQ